MNIIHNSWLSVNDINGIKQKYNAKFVCYTPLKTRDGGYLNQPCAIFYTEESHPEGSNWFALYTDYTDRLMITNAIEVEGRTIDAIKRGNDVIYSSYRHDMVCFERDKVSGNTACVDGGIDYLKVSGNFDGVENILLKVTKDGLIETGDNSNGR